MIKIGDTIWVFDQNHRVYVDDNGNKTSGPNYRHYWTERKVVGETSHSWLIGWEHNPTKISKKNLRDGELNICLNMEEVEEKVWLDQNKYPIVRMLQRCKDPEIFRTVEKLLE